MRPTLEEILSASLKALGHDKPYWKDMKNRRLPDAVKVKQFVAYLAHEIEGYPMTRVGAFLGLSHATISSHCNNAKFFLQHEPDYREAMDNALEIVERLKGTQKHVSIRGWVARDKDGSIFFYEEKPYRGENGRWLTYGYHTYGYVTNEMFPKVTWESEPQEAEITIKLK